MSVIDVLVLTVCAVLVIAGMALGFNEDTK